MTPVQQLTFCEVKSYMFLRNKSIINLTSNHNFWPKCHTVIQNNSSFSEKSITVVLSHQNQPTYCLELF